MKKRLLKKFVAFLTIGLFAFILGGFKSSQKEPWTQDQLLSPQDLSITLTTPQSHQPLVLSVGPAAVIKNSIDIGPAGQTKNLEKLKQQLKNISKEETIVVYCGCCPFDKCPNIRPAFELLTHMEFKNRKLLNLPHNIKVDWIDHGYPVNE